MRTALRALLLACILSVGPVAAALASSDEPPVDCVELGQPEVCAVLDAASPGDPYGEARNMTGQFFRALPVKVWTSENDGNGSELDADLLGGLPSRVYVRNDADLWRAVRALEPAHGVERAERIANDTDLRGLLAAESAARATNDEALGVDLVAEAQARAAADASLAGRVDALEGHVNDGAFRGNSLDVESSGGNLLRVDPALMRILFEHSGVTNLVSSTNAGLTVNNVTASRDGRLGVGMLYPSEAFDVAGNARIGGVADPYLRLQPTTPDGKSWLVQSQGNGRLRFFQETDARQPLTLQPGGEVDVGGPMYVYGPATFRDTLNLNADKPGNLDLWVSNANASGASRLLASKEFGALAIEVHGDNGAAASDARAPNSGTLYHSPNSPLSLVAADNALRFYTGCDAAACQRMHIAKGGDVGIGTTAPHAPLQVSRAGAEGVVIDGIIVDNPRAYGPGAGNFGAGIAFSTTEGGAFRAPDRVLARVAGVVEHETSSGNGALAFYTRSGCETCVTEKLRVTSEGKVGIGTTSPQATLDVRGDITGGELRSTSGRLALDQDGYANWAFVLGDPTGKHRLSLENYNGVAPDAKVVFQSDGRVGIGTADPQEKLEVDGVVLAKKSTSRHGIRVGSGEGSIDGFLFRANKDGDHYMAQNYSTHLAHNAFVVDDATNTWESANAYGAHRDISVSDDGFFFRARGGRGGQGPATFADSEWVTHLSIDANGKVGIGTATPRSALDVAGDARVSGALMAYGGKAGFTAGGTDLILAGRGGGAGSSGRALVDAGGEGLIVNYANDFGRVTISGDVSVPGTLSLRSDAGDVINGPGHHWNVANDADGNVHLRSWSGRRVQINDVAFAQAGVGHGGINLGGLSENTDPVALYRSNVAPDQTELRLSVGDDRSDAVVVGYHDCCAPGNPWRETVRLGTDGNVGANAVSVNAIHMRSSSLGACDHSVRGRQQFVAGGTGVADALYMCMRSSADTYSWRAIQTG